VDSLVKTVVFTGPLPRPRCDAEVLVRQAGGSVADVVSKRVDVLVQGGRSPHYGNGNKGERLCKAEKLIRQGHPISVLNEREFLGPSGSERCGLLARGGAAAWYVRATQGNANAARS
jgi:NAD-dependent DNA ligase